MYGDGVRYKVNNAQYRIQNTEYKIQNTIYSCTVKWMILQLGITKTFTVQLIFDNDIIGKV